MQTPVLTLSPITAPTKWPVSLCRRDVASNPTTGFARPAPRPPTRSVERLDAVESLRWRWNGMWRGWADCTTRSRRGMLPGGGSGRAGLRGRRRGSSVVQRGPRRCKAPTGLAGGIVRTWVALERLTDGHSSAPRPCSTSTPRHSRLSPLALPPFLCFKPLLAILNFARQSGHPDSSALPAVYSSPHSLDSSDPFAHL